jgi:monoamine oxidase
MPYDPIPWVDRGQSFDLAQFFSPPGYRLWNLRSGREKRVAVIGGGIAGLTAAFELTRMGQKVSLFERSDRMGGRVYTDRHNGLYADLGAMRVPFSHFSTRHYLHEFKLALRPFVQHNDDGLLYLQGMRNPVRLGDTPACQQAYGIDPWLSHVSFQGKLNAATGFINGWDVFVEPYRTQATRLYAQLTMWQMAQGWTAPGPYPDLGTRSVSVAPEDWEYEARRDGWLWDEYACFLETIVDDRSFSGHAVFEVVGGMDQLVKGFSKRLPTGICHPRAEVTRIEVTHEGATLHWRDPETDGEPQNASFDYVVCAIPVAGLLEIEFVPALPQPQWQALSNVSYGSAAKVAVYCSQRIWEQQGIFGGVSRTDLPIEQVWYPSDNARPDPVQLRDDASDPQPGWSVSLALGTHGFEDESGPSRWVARDSSVPSQPGVLLVYMHGENARRFACLGPAQDSMVRQGLRVLHPGIEATITRIEPMCWDVQRVPGGGAFAMFGPGEHQRYAEALVEPLSVAHGPDRVFFAGEHVAGAHAWLQTSIQTALGAVWHVIKAP